MKRLADDRFDRRMDRAEAACKRYERKQAIKAKRRDARPHIQTSKVYIAFLIADCSVVQVYSMVAMLVLQDLSALYALIGAVVGEVIGLAAYFAKAYNETKQEELIKLERDKMQMKEDDPEC